MLVQPALGLEGDPADPGERVQQPPRSGRGDQVDQQPGIAHGQAAAGQRPAAAAVAAHRPGRAAAGLEQELAPVRGPFPVAGGVLGVQPQQPPRAAPPVEVGRPGGRDEPVDRGA
jgi:hypothetical protein